MAITKKTFTVADTPVDAGWKKESASTHRKYPATKSQMTLFDRALFMMTSRLQGDGITHALGPHHGKTLTSFQIFTVAAERLEEALRTACVLFREHDRAFIPGRAWPGGSRFFRAAFS